MPASFSCFALQVRVLGDELRALDDVLEVALRKPLALRDHAEAVRAGGLGGLRVLEDLIGAEHPVHRRRSLRVLRLRAEAAVLGAPAGLRVDQRAHVRRVAELVLPRLECAIDQSEDLVSILQLAEGERFFAVDERRQGGWERLDCRPP